MEVSTMREKLYDEIAKIPDEKVSEIFDFLHYFRLGLGVKSSNPQNILKLAGSWKDMSEDDYNDFLDDLTTRRKNAFISRRNREASVD
ncbi:hypothetical protein H8E88_08180 [candidate division KSB1 bacterium]|nr:hypothetical protein [candidate division KSB1 bacterium]